MSIFIEPMGKLIVGNTLDCNKKALERSLKFYDPQLYLKWNPKKRGGWGKWEVRRKPETSVLVYQGEWNGGALYTSEVRELDVVSHVLDLDVLRYDVLGKIKSMDTWNKKNWADSFEYEEGRAKAKMEKAARDEMAYNVKQHKREWREFAQLVSQGVNPAQVLKGRWG